MKKYWELLEGKKTFLVAGLVAAFTFAKMVGWITVGEFEAIMGFMGALGLYTLRDAISKL